jgi:hypothetical protein
MCRHDGLPVSAATVLRLLREEGLLLEASYQWERRQLAARRKPASPDGEPTRRNRAVDYNTDRPHEALSWHRPHDLCLGLADPGVPHFTELHVTS